MIRVASFLKLGYRNCTIGRRAFPAESEILSRLAKSCHFSLVYDNHSTLDRYSLVPQRVFGSSQEMSRLLVNSHFSFPRQGIIRAPKATIVGRNGWIYTKDGFLLSDCTWFRHAECELLDQTKSNYSHSCEWLRGSVLSICSDHSQANYGHFLLDCLARIHLLRVSGFSFSSVDYVLMPRPPGKNAVHLCEKAGIPLSKCIWADSNLIYKVDSLVATTFPGLRRSYPHWLPEYFRQISACGTVSPYRKLFIPRDSKTRNLLNEAELQDIALNRGYEVFRPSQSVNAFEVFSQASHVVSAHGAALADLAFCHHSAKVLELIPTDHIYPYYFTLSMAAGLKYSCIFGDSTAIRGAGSFGPSPHDFEVNPIVFAQALDYLDEGS